MVTTHLPLSNIGALNGEVPFQSENHGMAATEWRHCSPVARPGDARGPAATPIAAGLSLLSGPCKGQGLRRITLSAQYRGELARRRGVALMPKQVLYRWAIYLIRGRAALLGSVIAPDQQSAIVAAIEKFGITPRQAQLLARRIGNVHRRSQRNVSADIA
jgi:hypothetical protein